MSANRHPTTKSTECPGRIQTRMTSFHIPVRRGTEPLATPPIKWKLVICDDGRLRWWIQYFRSSLVTGHLPRQINAPLDLLCLEGASIARVPSCLDPRRTKRYLYGLSSGASEAHSVSRSSVYICLDRLDLTLPPSVVPEGIWAHGVLSSKCQINGARFDSDQLCLE